ncbi:hypothetical protein MmTuc01_0966 [Methanosarcina mazei Tuc01]|uniref:Uncharacterized protein n=1 Tax=Methanosarcina mazei Tuc01 TaxID=1236903 RepID=M1Q284_METMZ|nr:hypothetical protein MmTuc01_0966 [Methanosarcina mazei Tuc01]
MSSGTAPARKYCIIESSLIEELRIFVLLRNYTLIEISA